MKIINIDESWKEAWNEFIAENCLESFLQSWEWGEFNRISGRKVWRLGVIENNLFDEDKTEESQIKLLVVSLIIKYDLPFGWSYLYCPRGPVINESQITNHKSQIFNILFNEIKKIAKKEKSLFLKIDLPIEMNHEYFSKFKKSQTEIQPKDTLMLNLEKPEEDLLKEMKQKTRYNIRLAEKKGIKITNYKLRADNKKEFEEKFEKFWQLVEETSQRDKFRSHNKDYYWKMLKSLNKENCACDRKLLAKLYFAEYDNKIIASNIVLYFGDYCVYLHGASSNKYRNVMAPYLLQWQQISDAKKAGCKRYDFWGIQNSKFLVQSWSPSRVGNSGSGKKIQNSWHGITRFKKGFGGYEKNYIGAYNLVFSSIGYTIYKLIKSIKLKVYKAKSLFCKN